MQFVGPGGRLVLLEGDESVAILVAELHIPGGPMHDLPQRGPDIPVRHLLQADEAVERIEIDLGEEGDDAACDVEAVLVVQKVLGVHEILPLGLALVAGGGEALVGLPLPFPVLAAALNVGDNGVEGDRRMLPSIEGGAKLEAAMVVITRGFCRV